MVHREAEIQRVACKKLWKKTICEDEAVERNEPNFGSRRKSEGWSDRRGRCGN